MDLNKAFEIDNGIISDGAVLVESLAGSVRSTGVTYSNDLVSSITYYKSLTKTIPNRIYRVLFAYSGDLVSTLTYEFYDTDGSTIINTRTITLQYSGDEVTGVDES